MRLLSTIVLLAHAPTVSCRRVSGAAAHTVVDLGSLRFGPAVDPSPCSYVLDFPAQLISQGKFHNVGLTVGHNTDEGLLFTPPTVRTQDEFIEAIEMLIPTANASIISYFTEVLYPPVFNGSYGYISVIGRTALAVSDLLVGCNANIMASTLSPGYAHLCSVHPALRGEDIPYTFFNGDTSTTDEGLPINGTVAEVMQRYLTNFVLNGHRLRKVIRNLHHMSRMLP